MADGANELRLITFRVGPETFVLDIMAVRQIVPYGGTTSVPTAPEFVEGIIVLRNEVIPVIDLRTRLYPRMEQAPQPLILITHTTAGKWWLSLEKPAQNQSASWTDFAPAIQLPANRKHITVVQ